MKKNRNCKSHFKMDAQKRWWFGYCARNAYVHRMNKTATKVQEKEAAAV